MLDLAILGLLTEQDLHGYELKKRLGEMLGVASSVSFGSLYPALGRLERSGAVHTVEPGAGRGGRSRKVYGITPRGDELFAELLAAESSGDDSRLFHLRLAFARHLSADARLGMLERRRAQLLDRLTRAAAGGRGARRLDGYVRSLMEHDRESTEHDLSWIERLIATERDQPPLPPTPAPAGTTPVDSSRADTTRADTTRAGTPVDISRASTRRVAPPTLAGLRLDSQIPRLGRDYQEESNR